MKKYIGILFACILFTGCSAEKSLENKPLYSIAENGVEKTQAPQGCRLVTEPEEFMAVTEKSGEDVTSGNNNHMLVDGGTVDTGSRIYSVMDEKVFFYDKKTGAEDILCSKPDCGHISVDCPANVSGGGYGLAYYNGALYTINPYDLCLMKLSEDGTEYDKVLELCGTTQDEISRKIQSGSWYTWILYRGYIYYIYSYYAGSEEDTYYLNGSHCIYRMALDGNSEPECLMPVTPGSVSELVQFQTAGDYVYMSVPDTHEDKDAYGGCMYRYNIAGNQMENFRIHRNGMINRIPSMIFPINAPVIITRINGNTCDTSVYTAYTYSSFSLSSIMLFLAKLSAIRSAIRVNITYVS